MSRDWHAIERQTKESKVLVEVDLDGTGRDDVSTGVGFYDHMLDRFAPARAGRPDRPDRGRPPHRRPPHRRGHRDRARPGAAQALGDKAGIRRFGDATVPLDEALVQAAVDLSGRPYCVHTGEPEGQQYVDARRRLPGLADPARLRVVRLPRPDRAARARAGRPRRRTTSWRRSSRRSPGRCATPSRSTRARPACPSTKGAL